MSICFITGYGKRIRAENGLIAIDTPPGENVPPSKTIVTPADLSLFIIAGDHLLTTGAIRILLENDAELALLDRHGTTAGFLLPGKKSPVIEHAERQQNLTAKMQLAIARAIVGQAIENKTILLRSIHKNVRIKESASIPRLQDYASQAGTATSVASLLGIEGSATREYYLALQQIIPESFGFHGRTRHPPLDPVNSLFSYGYGILYAVIRTALVKVKLSPYYGVLHADYKKQEPLVYDFIEEFRQPIVDRVVLSLINRSQVDPGRFIVSEEGCRIPDDIKRVFAESVLGRLDAKYEYEGQPQPFSDVIDTQAGYLALALLNGKPYRPFSYR